MGTRFVSHFIVRKTGSVPWSLMNKEQAMLRVKVWSGPCAFGCCWRREFAAPTLLQLLKNTKIEFISAAKVTEHKGCGGFPRRKATYFVFKRFVWCNNTALAQTYYTNIICVSTYSEKTGFFSLTGPVKLARKLEIRLHKFKPAENLHERVKDTIIMKLT